MSTRKLSDPEVLDLVTRNPQLADLVNQHEQLFGYYGWQTWDQTRGDVDTFGIQLPIPPRGVVLENDEFYGHVIVYPDAAGVLRFTSTDNAGLVAEIAKPTYVSDPDYWQLFDEIAGKYKEALNVGYGDLGTIVGAALVLGLIVLLKR